MDNLLVGAALLSAVLHAAWNAAVKASPHPAQAMLGQMLVSAVLALPLLAWAGLPPPAAWPWLAASLLLNVGAVAALLRGYVHAGLGIVYPMARASSVLLVLPLAAAVAGERPAPLGMLGIALVSTAMLILALGTGREGKLKGPALGWILAAGVFGAGYAVCDAQGVRQSQSPLAYGAALTIVNAATWAWLQQRAGVSMAGVAAQWRRALPAGVAAMLSYLLILWAFQHGPIALGAALRDTSAVFAALIAVTILKEPLDRRVPLAVLLATVGSMLIRLG
ncbi:DMT family transporter [Variovorax defluvii]